MTDEEAFALFYGDPKAKAARIGVDVYQFALEYGDQALTDLQSGKCMRCGNCCKKIPCQPAQSVGCTPGTRCRFLTGDTPGSYACKLIEMMPDEMERSVGVGHGCNDPLNMDRLQAAKNQYGAGDG